MKLELSRQIFEKKKLEYEVPSKSVQWSRVVSCGQTDGRTDKQTYMTKLTAAFRNFVNLPKNCNFARFVCVCVELGLSH